MIERLALAIRGTVRDKFDNHNFYTQTCFVQKTLHRDYSKFIEDLCTQASEAADSMYNQYQEQWDKQKAFFAAACQPIIGDELTDEQLQLRILTEDLLASPLPIWG